MSAPVVFGWGTGVVRRFSLVVVGRILGWEGECGGCREFLSQIGLVGGLPTA